MRDRLSKVHFVVLFKQPIVYDIAILHNHTLDVIASIILLAFEKVMQCTDCLLYIKIFIDAIFVQYHPFKPKLLYSFDKALKVKSFCYIIK